MKNTKQKLLALLMAATMTVSMTACTTGGTEGSAGTESSAPVASDHKAADLVSVGIYIDPNTMDPHATTSQLERMVFANVYDSLFEKDSDGNVSNCLINDYSMSEDGMSYTFNLKEGILFHNGEELKASDVKFTFERAKESAYIGFLFYAFDTIEVVNDYTVTINLSSPFPMMEEVLALPQASILNEKAVTEAGDDFGRNPVGCGAYEFSSWSTGEKINFVAFDDYHKGEAEIENLEFMFYIDRSTGYIALETGIIDAYWDILSTDRQRAIDNENIELSEAPSLVFYQIIMNHEYEPLSDNNVRLAIAHAIDLESVNIAQFNGIAKVADSPVADGMFGSTDAVSAHAYDVELAKEYLSKSAYPDGFDVSMCVNAGPAEKVATVIQANLREIGINLKIDVMEFSGMLPTVQQGDYQMTYLGKTHDTADPSMFIRNNFHTENIGGNGNYQRYSNSEVDAMIEEVFIETDPATREQLLEDILISLNEEVANIPTVWMVYNIAYNANLEGVQASAIPYYEAFDYSWK